MSDIISYLEAFNSWEFDNGVFHITGMGIYSFIAGVCFGICLIAVFMTFRRESRDE